MMPKLEKDDYLNKGFEFWKNYRELLTEELSKSEEILPKTPENIVKMAKEVGVKPTARYFDICPSSVRYYIKRYEQNNKFEENC